MGVGLIILGMATIALGVIGLMAARFQNECCKKFFTLAYIIAAGVFAFILIIIGLVLGGFAGDTMFLEIRNKLCDKVSQAPKIKYQYDRAVNAQMCSSQCPCDGSDWETRSMWESYATAPEAQGDLSKYEKLNSLAYFGRDVNGTYNWPQYGSSHYYRST